jgi:Zn-dependent membrane protease YugP
VSVQSKRVAWGFGKTVLRAVRFSLYVVLLLIGRVLVPVASLVTAGGFILFFFSLLFLREHTWLIVFGACLAAGGVLLQVFYDAALRLVAPDGAVIVSDL